MTDFADPTDRFTDQELRERLRNGDHGAFDAIFRANYAGLVGVAERMLRDREVAEEVVQDVFLEIWRRRDLLVIEETIRAYLYRATRNRALNRIRRQLVERKTQHLIEPGGSLAPTSERAAEREIEDAVSAAIASLPERCREVFQLSRGSGLKYVEIAATMGISVKTVEAQMGKALRLLRERLAGWLEQPPSG